MIKPKHKYRFTSQAPGKVFGRNFEQCSQCIAQNYCAVKICNQSARCNAVLKRHLKGGLPNENVTRLWTFLVQGLNPIP